MVWLSDVEKKFEDTITSFDIHERDRWTDRQTDAQTPHDGIRPRLHNSIARPRQ